MTESQLPDPIRRALDGEVEPERVARIWRGVSDRRSRVRNTAPLAWSLAAAATAVALWLLLAPREIPVERAPAAEHHDRVASAPSTPEPPGAPAKDLALAPSSSEAPRTPLAGSEAPNIPVLPTPKKRGGSAGLERFEPVAEPSALAPEPSSADELLAAADAARAAHDDAGAVELLHTLVARFPHDPRSALASFTAGRLELDQLTRPGDAARDFERALELGLPQALEEDGLARLWDAHRRAGDAAAATAVADRYRARFPDGRRLDVDAPGAPR